MLHGIFFNTPIEVNFIGHQMSEIYRDRVYDPFLMGKKDLIILDIGANIGITSYYFSQFAKKVYSLEPSIEHYEILNKMIKFNDIKNIESINKALYIKSGAYPFYHNQNKTMYSLHQAVRDPNLKKEMVDCITIDKLLDQYNLKKVDFMKLDIEGTETEILSSDTFKKVSKKIDTIVLEAHDWSGRHPHQLVEALKNNNYIVEKVPTTADMIVARRK